MIFNLPFLKKEQLLSVYGLSKRGHIYYLSVHSTESRAWELYLAMVAVVTCAKQKEKQKTLVMFLINVPLNGLNILSLSSSPSLSPSLCVLVYDVCRFVLALIITITLCVCVWCMWHMCILCVYVHSMLRIESQRNTFWGLVLSFHFM